MIPYYLANNLSITEETIDSTTAALISSAGNTGFEIYYSGTLQTIGDTSYIINGEMPCIIVAKDICTKEEILLFDASKHGYDALFCRKPSAYPERSLKLYELYKGKIEIFFGYSIDYESEKEYYIFNDKNEVKLSDGTYFDFEKVKSIGYDWISMKFADVNKTFLDLELA